MINKVYKLLANFQRIDLDEDIAKKAGELFRDIKRTVLVPDYIVAASALQIGRVVLTLNKKHFEKIPDFNLYP